MPTSSPPVAENPDLFTADVIPTETELPVPDGSRIADTTTTSESPIVTYSSRLPEDYNDHRDTTTTDEPAYSRPPDDYNEHRDTTTRAPPVAGYVPVDDYHEHRTTETVETTMQITTTDAAGQTVSSQVITKVPTPRTKSFVSIPATATPKTHVEVTVTAADGKAKVTSAAVFEVAETDSFGVVATKTQTLLAQYADPTGLSGYTITNEELKWLKEQLYPLHAPPIAITYMPVLAAVILGIFWSYTCVDVNRLEEFYQLARPEGGLVKDTIGLDYLVQWLYLIPFIALAKKQWAVVVASCLFVLVTVVLPTVSSGLLMVQVHPTCLGLRGPDRDIFCNQQSVIHINWARATQGVLGLIAILGIILLSILFKRETGLFSDPASISGICALSWQKQVLDDLSGVPWTSSDSYFRSTVGSCRYRLGYFVETSSKSASPIPKYGIFLHPNSPRPSPPYTISLPDDPHSSEAPRQTFRPDRPMMLLTSILSFSFVLHLALLAIILLYRFTPDKGNPLNTFLSSETPYVRLALTLSATIIRSFWDPLDRDIRLLAPWKHLIKGNAKPNKSITLAYTYSIPIYTPLRALINKDVLVAAATFAAFVAEVLTVVMANVTFSLSQTKRDETFAGYFAIAGLSVQTLILGGIILGYRITRKQHHAELGLPRLPYSTLGVMSYIVGGVEGERVLERYEGVEGRKALVEYEERMGGVRYGFGYVRDGAERGGLVRLGVGEEPLLGMWSER